MIAYTQKTWKLNSGEPMHAESGYWRPKPDGTIEVVIAQSTGLVEVQVFLLKKSHFHVLLLKIKTTWICLFFLASCLNCWCQVNYILVICF